MTLRFAEGMVEAALLSVEFVVNVRRSQDFVVTVKDEQSDGKQLRRVIIEC